MPKDSTRGIYHIGGVAAIAGVHPQTLRLYERLGLIKPSRSLGKTRLYSQRDVERVTLIVHLTRDEGLNLAGVAKILELQDHIREVEAAMQQWMHEWQERMESAMASRGERVDATPPKGRAVAVPIRRG